MPLSTTSQTTAQTTAQTAQTAQTTIEDNNCENENIDADMQAPDDNSEFTSLSDTYFTERGVCCFLPVIGFELNRECDIYKKLTFFSAESWQDLLTPYVLYPEQVFYNFVVIYKRY